MSHLIAALPLLACPLGMGVMMLFMGRGHRGTEPGRDTELARLQAEIDRLRQDVTPGASTDATRGNPS